MYDIVQYVWLSELSKPHLGSSELSYSYSAAKILCLGDRNSSLNQMQLLQDVTEHNEVNSDLD